VPNEPPGTLTLIDLQRAETDPAHSVLAAVDAGREGTLRRAGLDDDGLHDLAVFSLLDDEL
jgi:hypothetical protein